MNAQMTATAQPAMNQMLELFKMQYIMKAFEGNKGGNSQLLMMFLLLGYDQLVKYLPTLLPMLFAWLATTLGFQKAGTTQSSTNSSLQLASLVAPPPPSKEIKAFIQFERGADQKVVDQRIDSVLYHVCNLPEVRSLRFNGVEMIPNFRELIMIDNDIWFQILNPVQTASLNTSSPQQSQIKMEPIQYKLATYDHDITWLHRFVEQSIERYEQEKKNKLGSEMYYFDHIVSSGGPFSNPLSKEFCSFRKSKFFSNRSLANIYLKQIDELKHRVEFFMKRRDWYDSKGIPHTLGIVMYGHPGCGKTSTIKAIANETKRHIFNIMLSEIKTKQSLKDLFYNDVVHIMADGKMEVLNIPVKQRLYVIEDVDAMDSVVIKRTAEQIQKEEERKLRLEAEKELLKEKQGVSMANKMMEGRDDSESDKLDLATLLNVLDGVRETPGRIIILSTNYPERLDQALLRPGRFDILLEYEKHNNEVLIQHVERFYDITLSDEQRSALMDPALDHKWTPAEVGQILFKNILSVEGAIHDLVDESPQKLFRFSRIEDAEIESPSRITDETKETQKFSTDIESLLKIEAPVQEKTLDHFKAMEKSSDSDDANSEASSWTDLHFSGGTNAIPLDPPSKEQVQKAEEVRKILFQPVELSGELNPIEFSGTDPIHVKARKINLLKGVQDTSSLMASDETKRASELLKLMPPDMEQMKMIEEVTAKMMQFQQNFEKEFGLSGYSGPTTFTASSLDSREPQRAVAPSPPPLDQSDELPGQED